MFRVHHYYVVQPGDTLSGIAYAFLGNANDWRYLQAINGLPNANYLYVGEPVFVD